MRTTKKELLEDIEYEGFDYALNYYADYSQIPDEKFQLLYKQYLSVRKELMEYLGVKE